MISPTQTGAILEAFPSRSFFARWTKIDKGEANRSKRAGQQRADDGDKCARDHFLKSLRNLRL